MLAYEPCPACNICEHCELHYCRDEPSEVSPCEHMSLCAYCWPRGCPDCDEKENTRE